MNTDDIFNQNYSEADLSRIRAASIESFGERAPTDFTCDTCADRRRCVLVFDGYNTGGDCLADK